MNPPFAAPDENAHFLNIARIARGGVFPDREDGLLGSVITGDEFIFYNKYYCRFLGEDAPRYTYEEALAESYRVPTGAEDVFFPTDLAAIDPLAYLVPSLGVLFARFLFGAGNPYRLLISAKIANLLFSTLVIAFALKKTPIFRNTMLLLALMPMTIYQCASASYDAVLIPSSFLLFATAAKLLCAEDGEGISRQDLFAVAFASAGIFATKIGYSLLILLFFALCAGKFGGKKKFFSALGAVLAAGVVFALIPRLVVSRIAAGCENTVFPETAAQKEFLLSHPTAVFSIVRDTWAHSRDNFTFGFFGIFGSLDVSFPRPLPELFFSVLLPVSLLEASSVRKKISVRVRVVSLLGVFVFYVGTILALYLTWTARIFEVGGTLSVGTQGRYFIPVALFVPLVLVNPLLEKLRGREFLRAAVGFAAQAVSLAYLFLSAALLFVRYWV